MAWTATPKENFIHLTWTEPALGKDHSLNNLLEADKSYLLDLLAVTAFEAPEDLEALAFRHKEGGQSFILVVAEPLLNQFSDEAPVVPTWQEALDFLEMEDIERQLGF